MFLPPRARESAARSWVPITQAKDRLADNPSTCLAPAGDHAKQRFDPDTTELNARLCRAHRRPVGRCNGSGWPKPRLPAARRPANSCRAAQSSATTIPVRGCRIAGVAEAHTHALPGIFDRSLMAAMIADATVLFRDQGKPIADSARQTGGVIGLVDACISPSYGAVGGAVHDAGRGDGRPRWQPRLCI
jgi:hypothetical protein